MSEVLLIGTTGFVLVISIIVHELGHLYALRRYFPEANVTWRNGELIVGQPYMFGAMTRIEREVVLLAGVGNGLAPLIILPFIVGPFWATAALLLYGVGSWHDLKTLFRQWRA